MTEPEPEQTAAEAIAKSEAQTPPPSQEEEKQAPPSDESPDPEVFVNNGLEKWLAAREAWCRKPNCDDDESKTDETAHKHAIPVDVDGIIDVLFDPRWRGGGASRGKLPLEPPRFPKNVPLPQMIDVLTDLWEAEGLDV